MKTPLSPVLAALMGVATAAGIVFGAASASAGENDKCPKDMALVGDSCVDKYEASLVEVLPDGREALHSPYANPDGKKVKAVSRKGVVPQAHVSWHEAKAACETAGKRLCRANEWVAACKGPKQTKYPYGDERVANACVDTGRTAPLSKLYSANEMFTSKAMNDPRLNQMDNTVDATGAAASCTNDYGVHDMVGNVHEWADDGAFHGGYYLDTRINREGCDYVTTAHNREYYDYSIGFRCCADAGSLPVDDEVATSEGVESDALVTEVDDSFFANVVSIALGPGGLPESHRMAAVYGLGSAALPVLRREERLASR